MDTIFNYKMNLTFCMTEEINQENCKFYKERFFCINFLEIQYRALLKDFIQSYIFI